MRRSRVRFTHVIAIAACCYAAFALGESQGLNGGEYMWRLPPGFPPPAVPADNPMSAAKVALGCKLFFEPRLSTTGKHSCASCHRPELAFTDGRAQAIGATGATLARGAMTLANAAYSPAFTWASDRMLTLEAQMEQPLFSEHPVEMGLKHDDAALAAWFAADAGYTPAFQAAFPDQATPWSQQNMIKAIAAFERTLISGRSAFDRYIYDDDRAAFSATAKRGMALFFSARAGCSACHFGWNFSGPVVHRSAARQAALFANNGSYAGDGHGNDHGNDESNDDRGLITVTRRQRDLGRFRVPTLRNIALTAPYMHDGRFTTLEAVIAHYAAGGQRPDGHANPLVDPAVKRLDLAPDEQQALLEFLRNLTDVEFVNRDYSRCMAVTSMHAPL
jgi:cytochrome c peroxidase